MSEPEGVVLYDANADQLVTGPAKALVLTTTGWRELTLRVARGIIRDVPQIGGAHDSRPAD